MPQFNSCILRTFLQTNGQLNPEKGGGRNIAARVLGLVLLSS